MLYQLYEFNRAIIAPMRAAANLTQHMLTSPCNPFSYTVAGRHIAAASELFESITRRYGKPSWNIFSTTVDGTRVNVQNEIVWWDMFCDLRRFRRNQESLKALGRIADPKVLIVAPMSGHYATLLRGTVRDMLPGHDVYVTDWRDAAQVPVGAGPFGLHDFIDYVIRMLRFLGPHTHVMAVCQPGPAVLAAAALMAEDGDPATPDSMTIMGSPIDARKSPTEPNLLAESRPLAWFERNVIHTVPYPHPGFLRRVYPGFIQLSGFIAMNRDRHVDAHFRYFEHLVRGDGDSAQKHREFYDEYLAVMDLTAEFYLQTMDAIFQRHLLPRGRFHHRGRRVRPEAITETALMTVEGENDDISGIGQTQAAHDLCTNLPAARQLDYIQPGVGHYGVFNGTRFRNEIQPRIADFIREHDGRRRRGRT
ncbi:MAG: polyhydroxyalkanoate depolymerase [Alphaproteobacteria bacterium]